MPYSRAILRTNGESGPADTSPSPAGAGGCSGTGVAADRADAPTDSFSRSSSGDFSGCAGAGEAGAVRAGVGGAGAAAAGGAVAATCFAAAGAGAEAPFPGLSSILPTTVLMATVLPSSTNTSFSTPAAGEGISVSTLSVEISNSGSSPSHLSPWL